MYKRVSKERARAWIRLPLTLDTILTIYFLSFYVHISLAQITLTSNFGLCFIFTFTEYDVAAKASSPM